MEQRWIPVSERLPDEPKENPIFEGKKIELYLVTVKGADYPFRAFWNGKFFTDGWSKADVTAWMPLPEPYRGELPKQTNADRVRNMTDEELAAFCCKVKADYQWADHEYPDEDACEDWEEWLRAESEVSIDAFTAAGKGGRVDYMQFEPPNQSSVGALEELQQYRELGTPEDLKAMKEHGAFTGVELANIAAMQSMLREYQQIGTPKECQMAMEDQASRHEVNEVWSIYDVTGREYKGIEKKILPEYYNAVISGSKTFELRKDEDNIQAGDFIVLKEWDGKRYTGRQTWRRAKYVLRDVPEYGLCPGYCIVGW